MRKNINKLATLVMTGALAASMSFGAFADTQGVSDVKTNTVKSIVIDKNLTTDGKTVAPAGAEFYLSFEAPSTAAGDITINGQAYPDVQKGIQPENIKVNGKTAAEGKITFNTTDTLESDNKTYKKQFTIDVSGVSYQNAGIYEYIVKENGTYTGVDNDAAIMKMYVFVENDTTGTGVHVAYIVFSKTTTTTTGEGEQAVTTTTTAKSSEITNDYGEKNNTTHDLTIKKVIAGNLANMSQTFDFEVSIADDNATGSENFNVYKLTLDKDGNVTKEDLLTTKIVGDATTPQELTVDKTTAYRITGLTSGDKVSVYEKTQGEAGFVTTYGKTDKITYTAASTNKSELKVNKADDGTVTYDTIELTVSEDNQVLTITNTFNSITPTGVAMDIAPYALMVALAGGAAATFLRKKESFED